jgi:hypothetical protein
MAIVYNNFNQNTLMSFAKSFAALNGQPLDQREIYTSFEALQEAAAGITTYVGQTLKYINEADKTVTAYLIKDEEGNLEELGTKAFENYTLELLGATKSEDLNLSFPTNSVPYDRDGINGFDYFIPEKNSTILDYVRQSDKNVINKAYRSIDEERDARRCTDKAIVEFIGLPFEVVIERGADEGKLSTPLAVPTELSNGATTPDDANTLLDYVQASDVALRAELFGDGTDSEGLTLSSLQNDIRDLVSLRDDPTVSAESGTVYKKLVFFNAKINQNTEGEANA